MLTLDRVSAGYGDIPVLREVGMTVAAGEWVAILGPSGAGKTTLLKTVAGLLRPTGGSLRYDGEEIGALPAYERVERGITLVPEGRRLFTGMTVLENLRCGAYLQPSRSATAARLAEIYALFPILEERAAQVVGSLSGGEQQMCAIGRALMSRPRLLLVDELSLGLAPLVVERLIDALVAIRAAGTTLVVVDQIVTQNLAHADRGYLVRGGRVVKTGAAWELLADPDLAADYFGRQAR